MEQRVTLGYMCKTDFDYELGEAADGSRVYPSVESLKKYSPCYKQCGIVEVEVRFKSVVQESDFSDLPEEVVDEQIPSDSPQE
jgi:hypothetical protein